MSREEYKNFLLDLLEENPQLGTGKPDDLFYELDEIKFFSSFHSKRGTNHWILKPDLVTWSQIEEWGRFAV